MTIPRHIGNTTEKIWKNTVSLFEYCAQFCFSGSINAWLTDNGKLLAYHHIEPIGEKTSVMLYQEGKKLSEQSGKEKEAIQLLTEAIEKYDRHSQAYERRGYINFHLKNYDDAIYDFTKSVALDSMNASSLYGLGRALIVKKNFTEAIAALDETIKHSIPLQPLYWAARRVKANCLLELKDFEKAEFEYRLFTSRTFIPTDPNYKHLSLSWFNYAKALFALGKLDAALEAFDKSLELDEGNTHENKAEVLMHRGIARKAAGNSDYILDIKKASEMGNEWAIKMMSELS
jgi:tetratricopeptide (TPR) repeat protein